MTIGNCRFLYNNLIETASSITSSNGKTGLILNPLKAGLGSATLLLSGTYTGNDDLEYIVEIDSVSGGAEVGQATYRWKTDQDITWTASGVTTSTTATLLSNGVYVRWMQGADADFVSGDKWYFKVINRFSTMKLYDFDRDTFYRSADSTNTLLLQSSGSLLLQDGTPLILQSTATGVGGSTTLIIDFGAATAFNSVILFDHNLSNSAIIKIQANATNAWISPSFSETITYNASKILHYTSTTPNYRYARLTITDSGNTDGYIELGELFLGNYLELSRTYNPQFSLNSEFALTTERNRYGIARKRLHNTRHMFDSQIDYLTSSDIISVETMINHIADTENEILKPIYFNLDSVTPNNFYMMEWENLIKPVLLNTNGIVYYSLPLTLAEVGKSA